MTITYDEYETARIRRWREIQAKRAAGEFVSDQAWQAAEKDAAIAERSAMGRAAAFQQRQADADAELARQQAAQQARQDRAAEAFKRQAAAAFPGSPEEFESQWPAIKADWQRRQTGAQIDRLAASAPRVQL